ncbi:phosphoribosyltransferase domain-containing protein [Anaeromicropila populeti]|uniref:TRSP domain C terminus to PRTase_2 n=1 Tax=Anaeromicropila populeti TaxID=37658 RepID=A0A1I6IF12_9FIRM|nr:phosphoribosyltransferase domain-containing protein [Anaeromicropila populeti]SFR65261.1 TRSP domain C terminus to PRTase_2 [Anaeromicropila populeti]
MYREEDLVKIARRENNNKRKYLVVNKLQGKHVPVKPSDAFKMFEELADSLKQEYTKERLLLIGFTETATAIGAAVAISVGGKYMQTTREMIPDVGYLFFSEVHSHATEQKLVKDDIEGTIQDIDRIIFIEDEVTTGNTILNIINILEKLYPGSLHFSIASLLNGMDEEALERYRQRDIHIHYLVKTNHESYTQIAENYENNGAYKKPNLQSAEGSYEEMTVSGWLDARRMIDSACYKDACADLWKAIEKELEISASTLVIGTEEFMYPALYVASCIEEKGSCVKCHSTTRSPIEVCKEEGYPLHCRYELKSLYDKERKTFIYDLAKYDNVLIITDSQSEEKTGIDTLVNGLKLAGNKKIQLVRWRK